MTYTARPARRHSFRPRRRSAVARGQGFLPAPVVAFLLVASLGILFVGCTPSSTAPQDDEFTFTEDDIAHFTQMLQEAENTPTPVVTGSGAQASGTLLPPETAVPVVPAVDLSRRELFRNIRASHGNGSGALYIVNNEFLNVRSKPDVRAPAVGRLVAGESVNVVNFMDAAWAQVRLPGNVEGYVSTRYISRSVSESQLQAARAEFAGQYFVDFAYLNVRATADGQGEKIGELPGQSIVTPLSRDAQWARIMYNGREAFVSMEYLQPFEPHFVVRQDAYALPVLRYDVGTEEGITGLKGVLTLLRQSGNTFTSLRAFAELLLAQEQRDVRLPPRQMVLVLTGINAQNFKRVTEALLPENIPAVLALRTNTLGLDAITQKQVQTLLANGFDVVSAGHTGDDLRSLTDAQLALELTQSRALLTQYAQRDVISVLYPDGGVNDRVQKAADEAGYLLGVGSASIGSFTRQQLLALPSGTLKPGMAIAELQALLGVVPQP